MFGGSIDDFGEQGLGIDVVRFCCAGECAHNGFFILTAIGA